MAGLTVRKICVRRAWPTLTATAIVVRRNAVCQTVDDSHRDRFEVVGDEEEP
jgi:hypothetical protein